MDSSSVCAIEEVEVGCLALDEDGVDVLSTDLEVDLALETRNFPIQVPKISGAGPPFSNAMPDDIYLKTYYEDKMDLFPKLRQEIADLEIEEFFLKDKNLLRWLRSTNFDVPKAAEMMRKNYEWRRGMGMETILSWVPPEAFVSWFPFTLSGFDLSGDLFGVATYSKMNVKEAVSAILENRIEEYLKYLWQCIELLVQICKAGSSSQRTITEGIVIVDLEGFSMVEIAAKPAPAVFTVFWNLVKPFLSESTLNSIQIYSWYTDEWKNELRSMVPLDLLPAHYGGNNTSTRYYNLSHGFANFQFPNKDFSPGKMTKAAVNAADKLQIPMEVTGPGETLRWAFTTEWYDIGFTLVRKFIQDGQAKEEQLIPYSRADSHVLQQKGTYVCAEPGQYVLVFDNTFSRWRAKNLSYVVAKE